MLMEVRVCSAGAGTYRALINPSHIVRIWDPQDPDQPGYSIVTLDDDPEHSLKIAESIDSFKKRLSWIAPERGGGYKPVPVDAERPSKPA